MSFSAVKSHGVLLCVITFFCCALFIGPEKVSAETTAFKQAIAEAAARDRDIAEFYQGRSYQAFWTGSDAKDKQRRAELLQALRAAAMHGLPVARYDVDGLEAMLKSTRGPRDLGLVEVEMSRVFLKYARDIQTGALIPGRIDKAIVREVPYRERHTYLVNFAKSSPKGFFKALPPNTRQYNALLKHKMMLERLIAKGGWGPSVKSGKLEPGDSGKSVVALRDRLVRMGYLKRSAGKTYGAAMKAAVTRFQQNHGLEPDGVVGEGTLKEINVSAQERLESVLVAMERERWVNKERGKRHIEVNLADFSAKVIDDGKITFETRSVIGHRETARQSPEFSDVMEHMVINPSWYVPRSIITKEYLPKLKANPYAVGHLEITDSRGRQVNRGAVDFNQFSARSFPYAMRQPPSQRNALGLVKFMFPNKHNIYLHDTPHKDLFGREVRAYSHGCIRLAQPFDFAYALLAVQENDPKAFFQSVLANGKETKVDLERPVPVHILYRTAFANGKGRMEYRRDIYGRDAKIWDALSQAGVALQAVQG